MARKRRGKKPPQVQLPKDALSRIDLGQSFAEYDPVLMKPGVFVETPALAAARERRRRRCFFVGRRGTGKTALTLFLSGASNNALQLHPQTFSPVTLSVDVSEMRDTRQRPFRTLVSAFSRALLDEVLAQWRRRGRLDFDRAPDPIRRERSLVEQDFDFRFLRIVEDTLGSLSRKDEKAWLRGLRRTKDLGNAVKELKDGARSTVTILIDRIDESWDGSDTAVVFLMALMHSCVELTASIPAVRPLVFLRENIFERVRELDNEFARLETSVVSLEWTRELLLEMIERRLNLPFGSKLPLRGPTWDHFFENVEGHSSRDMVFEFCQNRPRDVLIYCSFAVESAQSHKHDLVRIEDLQSAKRRFSDSRLKDLGDEYAENYPQIALVLSRFYGLGAEYTVPGITALIQTLVADAEVKRLCGSWFFRHTAPERFISLLYNIGFVGIQRATGVEFRALGPRSSTPPAIDTSTHILVHPSYVDALDLRSVVVTSLDPETVQRTRTGFLGDLPGAVSLTEYQDGLETLREDLETLPCGDGAAGRFEEIVGDIIRLCFFRALSNAEPRVRDHEGRVVRDWIAANVASSGFWEVVRQRYEATQVVWECKNYETLKAEDFHQASYYMSKEIGRFVVLAFRGDVKPTYYGHLKRISSEKNGIVLLLGQRDLIVFIRQARNGKVKEDHIQDVYDRTVRRIS